MARSVNMMVDGEEGVGGWVGWVCGWVHGVATGY